MKQPNAHILIQHISEESPRMAHGVYSAFVHPDRHAFTPIEFIGGIYSPSYRIGTGHYYTIDERHKIFESKQEAVEECAQRLTLNATLIHGDAIYLEEVVERLRSVEA